MTSRPNILYLTVDALRADRIGALGYARATTPNLDRLAEKADVCSQAFSLAPFTQSACIQLLTSSRPLSYGGYDGGARGRPDTVFSVFKNAGYHITCLSTLHWVNQFFGYGEGVDREYMLFSLVTLPGVALAMTRGSLKAYEQGEIDSAEMLKMVQPVLSKLFDDILIYCDTFLANAPELKTDFPDSALMTAGFDMARVRASTERHTCAFHADPAGYVDEHLIPAPGFSEWMGRWLPREWFPMRTKTRLIQEAIFRASNVLVGLVSSKTAALRRARFKQYPDARSIADKTLKCIDGTPSDQPFFLWTHFMDTHAPYVSGAGRHWYQETPYYLRALGYDPTIDPSIALSSKPKRAEHALALSALYDCAVRSTDHEIGRIINGLERRGLLENTIIAISGDHGEELGEHGEWGHFFRLYDELTRVPMIVAGPGAEGRQINGFTTILDLAPTLAARAGVKIPADWEGKNITSKQVASRDAVVCETFYGGNCVFDHRPLYMSVRTHDYLYFWIEYPDPLDKFTTGAELYDLRDDPAQQNNIITDADPALIRAMQIRLAARMREIPEVSDDRIARAFGDTILDALAVNA